MGAVNIFRLSALLLAGGQGSRLGGRDKGLMPWCGEPIAARLTALLAGVASEVLISCNRNQDIYQQWADKVILDDEPDFPGPLAGILAGMRECNGTHLLIVPCDMPQVNAELLMQLLDKARSQPAKVCLLRAGEQWQPLLTVIPNALLPVLQSAWSDGQRSPLRWLLSQAHTIVQLHADDPRLCNANTPADWPIES